MARSTPTYNEAPTGRRQRVHLGRSLVPPGTLPGARRGDRSGGWRGPVPPAPGPSDAGMIAEPAFDAGVIGWEASMASRIPGAQALPPSSVFPGLTRSPSGRASPDVSGSRLGPFSGGNPLKGAGLSLWRVGVTPKLRFEVVAPLPADSRRSQLIAQARVRFPDPRSYQLQPYMTASYLRDDLCSYQGVSSGGRSTQGLLDRPAPLGELCPTLLVSDCRLPVQVDDRGDTRTAVGRCQPRGVNYKNDIQRIISSALRPSPAVPSCRLISPRSQLGVLVIVILSFSGAAIRGSCHSKNQCAMT